MEPKTKIFERGSYEYTSKKVKNVVKFQKLVMGREDEDDTDFLKEMFLEEDPWFNHEFKKVYKPRTAKIKDLILGVNPLGQIITIPMGRHTPSVAIVGARRTGKSLLLEMLIERAHGLSKYYEHKIKCGFLNDGNNESSVWHLPANFKEDKLAVFFERPCGMPIVQVWPSTTDTALPKNVPSIKICAKWTDFVRRPHLFVNLGKSKAHFIKLKDDLLNCTCEVDVMNLLEDENKTSNPGIRDKLVNEVNLLFEQKIFDISNADGYSELTLLTETREEHTSIPFKTIMAADLLPVLVTQKILNEPWFPSYYDNIINKLFIGQTDNTSLFAQKKWTIFLGVDELTHLSTSLAKARNIIRLITEGGPARIGLFWVSQNPMDIPKKIVSNSKYMCVFGLNNSEEINKIIRDYQLDKSLKTKIVGLDQNNQEFLACTSEFFRVYDLDMNEVMEVKEAQLCRPLYPLHQHKSGGGIT